MGLPIYGWQYEEVACPFCKGGKITCMWFPSARTMKRNVTASLPGKGSVNKSRETWIVKSGCPKCGKNQEEVEKELTRQGVIS